jgi:transcription termination/antitermination protein NusA
VQAVVQELRGEKIDIVPFDRDPARFVCAAIQPADVSKVIVDETDGRMELVVPDEKLSLAIGRKGQNVRLAAQLTGWKLDIISESKFRQMEEEAVKTLQELDNVSEAMARGMYRMGFRTLEEVAEASEEELATIPGVGDSTSAESMRKRAEESIERLRRERLQSAISKTEPLTEAERMMFVRGISAKAVQLLQDAGFRSLEEIHREDEDKVASRSGLGIRRTRLIKQGIAHFFAHDAAQLNERLAAAKAAAIAAAAAPAGQA